MALFRKATIALKSDNLVILVTGLQKYDKNYEQNFRKYLFSLLVAVNPHFSLVFFRRRKLFLLVRRFKGVVVELRGPLTSQAPRGDHSREKPSKWAPLELKPVFTPINFACNQKLLVTAG